MRLFRSMCQAEYEALTKSGAFQTTPEAMEGKWFAETFEDAVQWGRMLGHKGDFWVVEIDLDENMAAGLFHLEFLDGIGPARYAELHDLRSAIIVNSELIKIKHV